MRVYQISFDGDLFYLEAEGFGAAVKRWQIWMKNEYKEEVQNEWEPEEVTVIRNGFVLSKYQINSYLSEEKEK